MYDLFNMISKVSRTQKNPNDWHTWIHQQPRAVTLRHIKIQPTNLQSECIKDETTTTTWYQNVRRTQKKSESQMGFEPTTLCDLVGCPNHWATGDSMVSKSQFVSLDWNRITRLHSQASSPYIWYHVVVLSLIHSLWKLVGCILICLNVTVRCC